MMNAKIRLVVTSLLFLSWISWLGYLAFATRNTIVLSRPQIYVSSAQVVAYVSNSSLPEVPANSVKIKKVLHAVGKSEKLNELETITIGNLSIVSKANGWDGPGDYVLPLTLTSNGNFVITPIPPSPGYSAREPRIYQANSRTISQVEALTKNPAHN